MGCISRSPAGASYPLISFSRKKWAAISTSPLRDRRELRYDALSTTFGEKSMGMRRLIKYMHTL